MHLYLTLLGRQTANIYTWVWEKLGNRRQPRWRSYQCFQQLLDIIWSGSRLLVFVKFQFLKILKVLICTSHIERCPQREQFKKQMQSRVYLRSCYSEHTDKSEWFNTGDNNEGQLYSKKCALYWYCLNNKIVRLQWKNKDVHLVTLH